MNLATNMTKLVTEAADTSAARREAVAAIGPAVRRQLAADRAAMKAATTKLMTLIEGDLVGIASEAALIRGRAVDMIEMYTIGRKTAAEAQCRELAAYVTDLENAVSKLLGEYHRARAKMSESESAARSAYLQDLRARVQKTLTQTLKLVQGLEKDRARAGRIWRQHARAAQGRKPAQARPAAEKTAKVK